MGNLLNIKRDKIGRIILSVIFICFAFLNASAEGSRNLYPAGAKGGRATLFSGDKPTTNMPFPTRGVHFVYVKKGETIALASSVQAFGNNNTDRNSYRNRIKLFGIDGNNIALSVGIDGDTRGKIANRNQEKAGPRLPGQVAGEDRYEAIYHTALETGIYKVEFYGTRIDGSTGGAEIGDNRADNLSADATWVQKSNSNYIWAWDVSVANAEKTSWIEGRVYTSVLNMDNALNSLTEDNGFFGKFKILTNDGYVYNVDNNGQNGLVFTFMVNNRGFHVLNDPNVPSYSSVKASELNNVNHAAKRYSDPRALDEGAIVTQKIFYNLPDNSMPQDAEGAVPGGSTWLRVPERSLTITDAQIIGLEGSPGLVGLKGANIEFTNESGGDYYITIRPKAQSSTSFTPRLFSGQTTVGLNSVFWDGRDGKNVALPAGTSDVEVEINIRGAEVHFPYIDVEQNLNGIVIELLSTDLTTVISDKVFWDDSNIHLNWNGNGDPSAPINASHNTNPSGESSNKNGHKWGLTSKVSTGTWGDEHGIDTWTFIEGEKVVLEFDAETKVADLYTNIEYVIDDRLNANSAMVGENITYTVIAGNKGPSDVIANPVLNIKGAPFAFTVPVGVDIDLSQVSYEVSCPNGITSEAVAITYDAQTRTFRSELNLENGCEFTYTFTGVLSGVMGLKTAESTILRPNDVYDPDATNNELDTPPTNPHYECYNDSGGHGMGCNNIQEVTFMLLSDCTDEYLYYEDFSRSDWLSNDGRSDWRLQSSINLGLPTYDNGDIKRTGSLGGATSSYLFAPGFNDVRYQDANNNHSDEISVARIKNGYYSVNAPGFVQKGIPDSDSWHQGIWVENAPTNDPNIADSNYDWTPSWDKVSSIRDASGAVNGAAFLIRGSASLTQSIKPFYEFNVPGTIANGETYTLSLNSYVTYHDKDYMIMDVIDQESGHIYASVPLKYPGLPELPPGASADGFSLGWVGLQASVIFDSADCESNIEGRSIKIAIRGSQDRSLETGKGFGHTIIDDISFTKRNKSCGVPADTIHCEEACFSEVKGKGYRWIESMNNDDPNLSEGAILKEEFMQPATNGGFVMDIYYLDNSFNMKINGVSLHDSEIEFGINTGLPQNIRTKAGKKLWDDKIGGSSDIWKINNGKVIDFKNIHSNPTPVVRVVIDRWGNAKIYGVLVTNGVLEELEVFDPITKETVDLNKVHWISEGDGEELVNRIEVSQTVAGVTAMTVYGYGQNYKECKTCTFEKEGVFNDENGNGFAHEGETIEYTFSVKNLGDMDIYDVEIVDPLFGFTITLDQQTHQPTIEGVSFEGDLNMDGVLNRNETWVFTVKYALTSEDIFTNKGVYNRATVNGVGKLQDSNRSVVVESIDPTPYKEGDSGWDPDRPYHTFVPLQGGGLLISNPMIYQRMK